MNKIAAEDKPFHDWYRFVLSFPPHLVRNYLGKFDLPLGTTVLDPFCGTGTTLVEARINGYQAIGIEANPVAHFASQTKLNWDGDSYQLMKDADKIAIDTVKVFSSKNVRRQLDEAKQKLLITDSISPLPLHKVLILKDLIESEAVDEIKDYLRLALAKTIVFSASNLHFGPEVGVRGQKDDAPVIESWLKSVEIIASDLKMAQKQTPRARVIQADARKLKSVIEERSIDAVFTSPPYPNEKDYTRTTRLESVLLDFIKSKDDLRSMKKELLRSNTRGVYKDDDDDVWIKNNTEIDSIASEIERRRITMKKDSGFEKLYARVTKLYFGGMTRHLAELRPYLKKGALLGYVVGDQASYLQVMIRTGELLSRIACELGYEVVGIDLFRTRIATATKAQMREEVLILRWNG